MQLFISYSFASMLFASFQSHVVRFGPPCPDLFFPDESGSYIIPCCRSTLSPSSLFLKTAKNPLGVAYPMMQCIHLMFLKLLYVHLNKKLTNFVRREVEE